MSLTIQLGWTCVCCSLNVVFCFCSTSNTRFVPSEMLYWLVNVEVQTSAAIFLWLLSLKRHFCLQIDVKNVVHENSISFWNTQTRLSGTAIHAMAKVTEITFYSVLVFDVEPSWSSWSVSAWYCIMHFTAGTWLANWLIAWMNRCRGVPDINE